jgi:hypothetical protein
MSREKVIASQLENVVATTKNLSATLADTEVLNYQDPRTTATKPKLELMANMADDEPIAAILKDRLPIFITEVELHDLRELAFASMLVGKMLGYWHEAVIELVTNERINHERQHLEAMKAVGFTAVTYGLQLAPMLDNGVRFESFRAFVEGSDPGPATTKLDYARVLSAPDVPSPGDIELLKYLGYDNPGVVYRLSGEL